MEARTDARAQDAPPSNESRCEQLLSVRTSRQNTERRRGRDAMYKRRRLFNDEALAADVVRQRMPHKGASGSGSASRVDPERNGAAPAAQHTVYKKTAAFRRRITLNDLLVYMKKRGMSTEVEVMRSVALNAMAAGDEPRESRRCAHRKNNTQGRSLSRIVCRNVDAAPADDGRKRALLSARDESVRFITRREYDIDETHRNGAGATALDDAYASAAGTATTISAVYFSGNSRGGAQ